MGKAKHGSKAVKTDQKASKAKPGPTSSSWKPWSLADYGLRVETVKADGNCFFRAVAAQLEGASGDHTGYRQNTVSFMRQHRGDFEPFMEDGEGFERYCSRMAQDGTWANQQEQVALARHYGVMIRVYQANQPAWTIKPDSVPEGAPIIHLSYHDGEHYNSLRMASDTGSGPPKPITLQERPASATDWSAFGPEQIELVMQGTGCYDDKEAVQSALQHAKGDPDQAIELLIERLAAQAIEEQCEQGPHPAAQADAAEAASTVKPSATLPDCGRDTGECDTPATLAGQRPCVRLGYDECFLEPESQSSIEAAGPDAPGQSLKEQEGAQLIVANSRGHPNKQHSVCRMERMKGNEGVTRSNTQQDDDRGEQGSSQQKEPAAKHEKKPARNRPCPCRSGRRYKECCGPVHAAGQRRQSSGLQPSEPNGPPGLSISELYV